MAIFEAIAGGLGLVNSLFGSKKASNKASKLEREQANLAREQLGILQEQRPFLRQTQEMAGRTLPQLEGDVNAFRTRAAQYDPARESEQAMNLYDMAARDSLNRDIGDSRIGFSLRGFGGGSSDQTASVRSILGNRAGQRGQYFAGLRMGERGRKDAALTDAYGKTVNLFGLTDPTGRASQIAAGMSAPGSVFGSQAAQYREQANAYDPTASIGLLGQGLSGIFKRR